MYVVTPRLNCLDETLQMKGHNIWISMRHKKKKNYQILTLYALRYERVLGIISHTNMFCNPSLELSP